MTNCYFKQKFKIVYFDFLPPELIVHTFKFLNFNNLLNLKLTCKRTNNIILEHNLVHLKVEYFKLLPPELIVNVLSYLNSNDLLNLRATDKRNYDVILEHKRIHVNLRKMEYTFSGIRRSHDLSLMIDKDNFEVTVHRIPNDLIDQKIELLKNYTNLTKINVDPLKNAAFYQKFYTNDMIKLFPNLKYLYLYGYLNITIETLLKLKNVRTLKIRNNSFFRRHMHKLKQIRKLEIHDTYLSDRNLQYLDFIEELNITELSNVTYHGVTHLTSLKLLKINTNEETYQVIKRLMPNLKVIKYETVPITVYARNYNLRKIVDGMGGLKFSS